MAPPACFIAVGVTGHRLGRLDPGSIGDIAARADAVLRAIMAAGGDDIAPSAFRLVTGLADGADSIVADCALALGWTLDVVLAFARDDFARDFSEGDARDAHERRLAAAAAVFELPGSRDEAGSGAAYERVGRTVLAQSDLLIAIWDNEPARGRGGAAQIAAEAVLQNMPVILIEPRAGADPVLLWDGLVEHDLGAQTVETVARGGLDQLPALVKSLVGPPDDPLETARFETIMRARRRRGSLAVAYPLLLAIMGVRKRRNRGTVADTGAQLPPAFAASLREMLAARYAHADSAASHYARVFRSSYVTNFALAALAVVLSLAGLALPSLLKPVLLVAEVTVIGAILLTTRAGNRAGWHRGWLDSRQLAERLRCLAISAQLGELGLRAGSGTVPTWVDWHARATARTIGLPSVRVDAAYVAQVRRDLVALVDAQIAYLADESARMHRLEHRLHGLGTMLFGATALVCVSFLGFEGLAHMVHDAMLEKMSKPLAIAATILSAALPAIGAAIYGIRMQGDFAGTAERSESLGHHLSMLRSVIDGDDDSFDTLKRRVDRATGLLTEDLANWLATYHARPLTLPG